MVGTAGDLVRFALRLFEGQVLDEAHLHEMVTPSSIHWPNYGLGIVLNWYRYDPAWGVQYMHLGNVQGYGYWSYVSYLRDWGIAVATLKNTDTGGWISGAPFNDVAIEYCREHNCSSTHFLRGDVNGDGGLQVADAVFALACLFGNGPAPACEDAADANDDGALNVGDALKILGHIFRDGGPLPAPFERCGLDWTMDALTCEYYLSCSP